MRLFVGLDIPSPVKANLENLLQILRPAATLRWSPVANLHVTTKFIGQWPEPQLKELKAALAQIQAPRFNVAIRGLGWFPNPHSPRVFFAAIRANHSLPQLAQTTDEFTRQLGVAKEDRKYSPHLTLARIQEKTDLSELRRKVAQLPSDDFGEFEAQAFYLYLSETGPRGSVYTKLAEFPLG